MKSKSLAVIATCVPTLLAENAVAENLVMDDPSIQYNYSYEKLGSQHFCDLTTMIAKAPMVIKLTAAFITDDTKPKDKDVKVAYVVEAFAAGVGKNSQLETKPIKVVAGRIISDVFNSDVHAIKNIDKDVAASYSIPTEGSLSLFLNVVAIRGEYNLAVELEDHSTLVVNVHPTPKILEATEKWHKCTIAIMERREPQ